MKKEKISKMLNKDPLTSLALGRTIMANRRTLLSFLSTGFGLLGGGIGIIEYVDRPLIFFFRCNGSDTIPAFNYLGDSGVFPGQ